MDLGKINKNLGSYDFDFFISYSTLDREFSHKLLYELEKNGFKCWIAPRNIDLSRPYATEIKEAIEFSRFFILLFSKNYIASKYTYDEELKVALEFNKDIFAINIGSLPIDEKFSDLKNATWVNFAINIDSLPIDEKFSDLKNAIWANVLDEILQNPLIKYNFFYFREKLSSRIEQKIFEFKNKDDYAIQNKKTKNFKYLDNLIHSGAKEIVLDSDILLSDGEESEYLEGIKLDTDNLIIDGNGHTIDANGKSRIFECNGENILIKNITLKGSFQYGGAIYNKGILTISESIFKENVQYSEIIYNHGILTISESIFNENITDSNLIINFESLKIFNSEILNNESVSIISNIGSLQVFNSNFKGNCARDILLNEAVDPFLDIDNYLSKHENTVGFESDLIVAEGNLSISGCKFINNKTCQSIIFNYGKFCSIGKSIFESNISPVNIINIFDLILINPKIKDEGKPIINIGNIHIKNSSPNILNQIVNEGTINVDSDMIPSEEKFDFSYLDKKIHESTTKEIILHEDICLEDYERDFYEGGIELDIDNLIIDGNGKTIDGHYKSRIFIITASNITLKNITFKNGRSHKNYDNPLNNNGGAIKINPNINLTIENCKFINNVSEEDGGAILNFRGILTIVNSIFNENRALSSGGVIMNSKGNLTVNASIFNGNIADSDVGAIFNNDGNLTIMSSIFAENLAKEDVGAIGNIDGSVTITESSFSKNTARENGGAIVNMGELTITESKLIENTARENGGAIANIGELTITESKLTENTARYDGGAIANIGELTITESTLTENTAESGGGAIYNQEGELTITESTLNNNTAQDDGGAIYLYNETKKYESENCTFKDNKPDDVYEYKE